MKFTDVMPSLCWKDLLLKSLVPILTNLEYLVINMLITIVNVINVFINNFIINILCFLLFIPQMKNFPAYN